MLDKIRQRASRSHRAIPPKNPLVATEDEFKALLRERNTLVGKSFLSTLSETEKIRLRMVEWHIDRIEDARYGPALDLLEHEIELRERVGKDVDRLVEALASHRLQSHSRYQRRK